MLQILCRDESLVSSFRRFSAGRIPQEVPHIDRVRDEHTTKLITEADIPERGCPHPRERRLLRREPPCFLKGSQAHPQESLGVPHGAEIGDFSRAAHVRFIVETPARCAAWPCRVCRTGHDILIVLLATVFMSFEGSSRFLMVFLETSEVAASKKDGQCLRGLVGDADDLLGNPVGLRNRLVSQTPVSFGSPLKECTG